MKNNWSDRTPSGTNRSRYEAEFRLRYEAYDTIMRQERNKQANSRVGDSIPQDVGNIFSIIVWLVIRSLLRNKE
jgi:hypothetical protein